MKDIHARKPIDKTAARVLGSGEHYEPEVSKANMYDSDLPIVVLATPRGVDSLVGKRSGRLSVIGYHGARIKSNGEIVTHRWVMRCDCGRWTVRKSRAIKTPKTEEDCCDTCNHLRSVKYKYNNKI